MEAPAGVFQVSRVPSKVHIRRHPRRPSNRGLNSGLVVDHIHFEHKNLRAGWANVHAYVNGQLVTGQLRLVRKAEAEEPPPDVSSIADIFNDAIDTAFSLALENVPPSTTTTSATSSTTPAAPTTTSAAPTTTPAPKEEEEDVMEDVIEDDIKSIEEHIAPPEPTSLPTTTTTATTGTTVATMPTVTPPPLTTTPAPTPVPTPAPKITYAPQNAAKTSATVFTTPAPMPTSTPAPACPSGVFSVKGCCCKFPMTYLGTQYDTCIDLGHTSPWCYTDPEYSPHCGEEPDSVTVHASDHNFFTPSFLGKGNTKWQINVPGEGGAEAWWDHCGPPAVTTHLGCQCQFPFKYKGKEHNICIWDDNDTPWCPTTDPKCGKGLYKERGKGKVKGKALKGKGKALKVKGKGKALQRKGKGKAQHLRKLLAAAESWDECVSINGGGGKREKQNSMGKGFIPEPKGRFCGDTSSHWTEPWHFNFMCASGVCNYRCKNAFACGSCDGGNCACVDVRPTGNTCGDGTNRGPEYSHHECLSGKCVYDCLICSNCNGGNCKCS